MENLVTKAKRIIVEYFTLTPYLVSQAEAEQSIRDGVSFRGTNMIVLILAILIASLGLNTNSTAVIIGAMLISPLMGPIIGIGLGIGIQDFDLLRKSLRNLAMAAIFSILASAVYFVISPVSEGHSELLARTQPTIYDVLIGFVGGAAGIIAIASRNKGNVIPGVAIATALMPPLCTVGYGLATLQTQFFFGALYLFLINSIFICLATFIGVKVLKFKAVEVEDTHRVRNLRRWVYIISLLCLLPSIYLTYNMLRQSRFEYNAHRFVADECVFADTHVLSTKTDWSTDKREITITLIGSPLSPDSLQMALSRQLKFYNLEGTRLTIIQGNSYNLRDVANDGSIKDLYELSQAAIAKKQNDIDSLKQIIEQSSQRDALASSIAPELKVVFPEINALSVSRNVFADVDSSLVDTINVAMIQFDRPLTAAKRNNLIEYLKARFHVDDIVIVEVNNINLAQ